VTGPFSILLIVLAGMSWLALIQLMRRDSGTELIWLFGSLLLVLTGAATYIHWVNAQLGVPGGPEDGLVVVWRMIVLTASLALFGVRQPFSHRKRKHYLALVILPTSIAVIGYYFPAFGSTLGQYIAQL